MLDFTPEIGQHIDQACAAACANAKANTVPVEFRFNGTVVIAHAEEAPGDVRRRWDEAQEAEAKIYRASPEYAAQQAEQQRKAALAQVRLDHVVSCLPLAIRSGETEIVRWCRDFVPLNDWSYVTCDRAAVAAQLLVGGYYPSDGVNHPEVQTNPNIMARWIIGQVLDGLIHWNGVVHPMMATFAEEYLHWQETGVLPARSRLGKGAA